MASRRSGGQLDFNDDIKQMKHMAMRYKLLYISLAIYSIMTTLLNYPFQEYMKSKGFSDDRIHTIRLLFYIPWILKPGLAAVGDLIYPFKYRFWGWIVTLVVFNIVLTLLSLVFIDSVVLTVIATTSIIFTLTFFDAIGQGITVLTVDLEQRLKLLRKEISQPFLD